MISRFIIKNIENRLFQGRAIIILGQRRVGKTTLMQELTKIINLPFLWLDCDEPDIVKKLTNQTSSQLKKLIGNYKVVCIDEAQRVENIGLMLKIIIDNIKDIQLIVSGSSALELSGNINEPLTGRKFEFYLYPFSVSELVAHTSNLVENRLLENRLIYGLHPTVVNSNGDEKMILKELTQSYLYRDILAYKEVRKPHILPKLLQAIALQIGNEVSYTELSRIVEVDKETIERYIDLLEKSFVVFRLNCFSRNLRNEINRSKKIYFYDNGIRNALISNFNSLDLRTDTGALWENFIISERQKINSFNENFCNTYFWRTTQQQEIDYIEETNGKLYAFEIKWRVKSKAKIPTLFLETYKNSEGYIINKENFMDIINL